ncbi:MAG: acetyl-CoA carboxylase biotin carboxyl carrier protein [Timaviella obliquedivisa GSE-PSE-MK23-08B]|nr:acetyl-CoA carboxylase biotin carboxyl carrier protein [Timaviella obliquedivisa GSE-PSE-MK23-08B]
MELDFNGLRELLAAINQTDVSEFILKKGDFELVVRKGGAPSYSAPSSLPIPEPSAAVSLPPVALPPPVAPQPLAVSPLADKLAEVTSPMVGTFYSAPGPDEPAFVRVGDRIRLGQTVCIIEAMKLMNELEAEVAGEVVEILTQNGEPVEYGQVLMRVKSA